MPWAQFVFRSLGLTALLVVSLRQLNRGFTRSDRQIRVTRSMIFYVLVSAVSAAFSIHRGKSLEAMLNLLAITGLFLAAAMLVRGSRMLRGFALVEVLAAIPVAAYGILQHFRPELLPAANSYPGRALGPFGQPNRLGGYLAAAIPVALALSFVIHDRALKGALLLAVFGLMFCLVATYSRGAWIGLAAGLLVLAAALFRWPELQPRPAHLWTSLACVALPALLLLPSIIARIEAKPSKAEWRLPIDPEREGSGAMRLVIWKGSIAAGLNRPAVGSGIGAFREAYDRYKGPTMKRLEAEGGRTADQAHNHYLGLFAERGVLGLAAFALLVALSLGAAAAALSPGTPAMGRVLVLGFGASVVALLANGVLDDNLALVPHGTLLFANLGILAAAPGASARSGRAVWTGRAGTLAAVIAMGVSAASFAGSREAEAAALSAGMGRPDLAAPRYASASALAPWSDRYAVDHAVAAQALAARGGGEARLREAETAFRRAIAVNGSDPVTRHELARLYIAHRAVFGDAGIRAAVAELRAALMQNPYYAEIRNDLGVALLGAGDRASAAEAFLKASEGRSEFVDPLLNLAALALQAGDRVEARTWAARALERNPRSDRARALLAQLENPSN